MLNGLVVDLITWQFANFSIKSKFLFNLLYQFEFYN